MTACDLTSSLCAVAALQYLCHEVPVMDEDADGSDDGEGNAAESSTLLLSSHSGTNSSDMEAGRKKQYEGMTALEIAVLANAKMFISHRPVQRIINGMSVTLPLSDIFLQKNLKKIKEFELRMMLILGVLIIIIFLKKQMGRIDIVLEVT
jgi:hypothetical protein